MTEYEINSELQQTVETQIATLAEFSANEQENPAAEKVGAALKARSLKMFTVKAGKAAAPPAP